MPHVGFKFKAALAAVLFSALAGAPAFAAETIYDLLKADPQFSTLVQVIEANGVKYQYTATSPRTVFAPTNAAFDAIKGGYDDMISASNPSNKQNTQALLLYEIVPGRHTPESLEGKSVTVNTYQKDPVTITGSGGKLQYGSDFGAAQSGPAIEASNGIIVPVDRLPTPVFSQSEDEPSAP